MTDVPNPIKDSITRIQGMIPQGGQGVEGGETNPPPIAQTKTGQKL